MHSIARLACIASGVAALSGCVDRAEPSARLVGYSTEAEALRALAVLERCAVAGFEVELESRGGRVEGAVLRGPANGLPRARRILARAQLLDVAPSVMTSQGSQKLIRSEVEEQLLRAQSLGADAEHQLEAVGRVIDARVSVVLPARPRARHGGNDDESRASAVIVFEPPTGIARSTIDAWFANFEGRAFGAQEQDAALPPLELCPIPPADAAALLRGGIDGLSLANVTVAYSLVDLEGLASDAPLIADASDQAVDATLDAALTQAKASVDAPASVEVNIVRSSEHDGTEAGHHPWRDETPPPSDRPAPWRRALKWTAGLLLLTLAARLGLRSGGAS